MHVNSFIERSVQWAACAVSFVLWLELGSDLDNALWWAAKTDAHQIAGSVRPAKVALCLGWSLSVLGIVYYRYRAPTNSFFGVMAGVLLVQMSYGLVEINTFQIPSLYMIARYPVAASAFWLTPIVISTGLAYLMITQRKLARIADRIVVAANVGLSATMIWVSLFDIVYSGISWR